MTSPWPHEDLSYDFEETISSGDTRSIGVGGEPLPRLTPDDVAEVVRYQASYHGQVWTPGTDTGTELSLAAVLRLKDGRRAAVVAWNDYTGWGCQDQSDVRIGGTEDDVVRHGLDKESRTALGYETEVQHG